MLHMTADASERRAMGLLQLVVRGQQDSDGVNRVALRLAFRSIRGGTNQSAAQSMTVRGQVH